jgi:hypothetical protein
MFFFGTTELRIEIVFVVFPLRNHGFVLAKGMVGEMTDATLCRYPHVSANHVQLTSLLETRLWAIFILLVNRSCVTKN